MTGTSPPRTATLAGEQDFDSPSYIEGCYAQSKAAKQHIAALGFAGQLARLHRNDPTKRQRWVGEFISVLQGAEIPANALLIQFRRFWDHPEFRTTESLIDAGILLTQVRNHLPAAPLSYVASFLLQGINGLAGRQIVDIKPSKARACLDAIQRSGAIIPGALKSTPPENEIELRIPATRGNAVTQSAILSTYRRRGDQESKPRVIVFEQSTNPITGILVNEIFTRHWPTTIRISRIEVDFVIAVNRNYSEKDGAPAVYIARDPHLPRCQFVQVEPNWLKDLIGYSIVLNWDPIAAAFVANGGIQFEDEATIKSKY